MVGAGAVGLALFVGAPPAAPCGRPPHPRRSDRGVDSSGQDLAAGGPLGAHVIAKKFVSKVAHVLALCRSAGGGPRLAWTGGESIGKLLCEAAGQRVRDVNVPALLVQCRRVLIAGACLGWDDGWQ